VATYSFSTTLADAMLSLLYGTAISANAYTTSGDVYLQLHYGDPGSAGTTDVSAGSATRMPVVFGTAASGETTMTTANPQWTNGGTSETITAISIWTASTSGTFLCSGSLSASQAWASGNILQLSSLSITIPTAS
jgi:hypothetical protein